LLIGLEPRVQNSFYIRGSSTKQNLSAHLDRLI